MQDYTIRSLARQDRRDERLKALHLRRLTLQRYLPEHALSGSRPGVCPVLTILLTLRDLAHLFVMSKIASG